MFKKLMAFLLVTILLFSLAACGNNTDVDKDGETNSQSETTNNNSNKEDDKTSNSNAVLGQTLTFMGYKIGYPDGVNLSNSDYGQTFRYNSEIAVLIEAPSVAGVMLGVDSIENVVTPCEEYVAKTFENTVRELFSFGATTQKVNNSEKKNINGIEMLRVEGEFSNSATNKNIAYVGYYFLLETDPIYIVGVPMNEGIEISDFIDQIAESIKK